MMPVEYREGIAKLGGQAFHAVCRPAGARDELETLQRVILRHFDRIGPNDELRNPKEGGCFRFGRKRRGSPQREDERTEQKQETGRTLHFFHLFVLFWRPLWESASNRIVSILPRRQILGARRIGLVGLMSTS